MRLIIEFDGPVFDPAGVYYAAHQAAASDVGWSRLDQATFWRLLRTKGRQADVLPGAKPVKTADYQRRFDDLLESDALLASYEAQADVRETMTQVMRAGPCLMVTLGSNLDARRAQLARHGLAGFFVRLDGIEPDPRRRPAQLRGLAAGDRCTLVVAGTDSLLRAAVDAELFTLGIASGCCCVARLHQAGADVVYRQLDELATSFRGGAADLIHAGLLPPSLDPPR